MIDGLQLQAGCWLFASCWSNYFGLKSNWIICLGRNLIYFVTAEPLLDSDCRFGGKKEQNRTKNISFWNIFRFFLKGFSLSEWGSGEEEFESMATLDWIIGRQGSVSDELIDCSCRSWWVSLTPVQSFIIARFQWSYFIRNYPNWQVDFSVLVQSWFIIARGCIISPSPAIKHVNQIWSSGRASVSERTNLCWLARDHQRSRSQQLTGAGAASCLPEVRANASQIDRSNTDIVPESHSSNYPIRTL